jgi:hypothetical protein
MTEAARQDTEERFRQHMTDLCIPEQFHQRLIDRFLPVLPVGCGRADCIAHLDENTLDCLCPRYQLADGVHVTGWNSACEVHPEAVAS